MACCRSILLAGMALMVAACSNSSPQTAAREKFAVNIAGSTSVMPFSEKLAEHFMLDHPTFAVNVQAGGSTAGVQACITHTVDIGMCSRDLKAEEQVLTAIPICYDGIAIVVNPLNPVTSLSLAQVRSIFNGSVKNWSQLGWIDRRIDAVSREEGSGTRRETEKFLESKGVFLEGVKIAGIFGSTDAVKQAVKAGLGVAILSKISVADELKHKILHEIRLTDIEMKRKFFIVTHKKRTLPRLYDAFLEFIVAESRTAI